MASVPGDPDLKDVAAYLTFTPVDPSHIDIQSLAEAYGLPVEQIEMLCAEPNALLDLAKTWNLLGTVFPEIQAFEVGYTSQCQAKIRHHRICFSDAMVCTS